MTTIKIEIINCSQCPHFEITNVYSTDGFDRMSDWHCRKKDKKIEGAVEWHDKVEVPEWCPIKIED